MRLPKFRATTAPPRETGLVRADPQALTDTGDAQFRAIAGAGRAIQDLGSLAFDAHQKRVALDDQAFAGEADKRAFDSMKTGLSTYAEWNVADNNKDPRDIKNYYDGTKVTLDTPKRDEFTAINNKEHMANILNLAKGFKSKKTAQAFINRWGTTANEAFVKAGHKKHNDYHEELFLGNARIAAANGDMEVSEQWIKLAEDSGLIGPKLAGTERSKNAEISRKGIIDTAAAQAFTVWQSTVTPENPDGDLNVAFDFIQKSEVPDGDKQEVETELKTRATNRRAENKLQLEAAQEESRDNINKALFENKDYDAANVLIKSSPLGKPEQTTLFKLSSQRATAAARGVPLKNDRVVESEMYDLSLGIWKGNITKKEFDAQLLKVANKLDDAAWNRLTASASNTLKSSQAESLTRASTAAKNVLVDFKSEDAFAQFISDSIKGLKPDVAKAFEDNAIEKRQLQFNNLTQYDNETREWIAANPDKVGKDFFQFSEALKHEYWNRNIDNLRELRKEQQAKGTAQTEVQDRITVGTQAEYDALPSGTRYEDPNGVRGTKP